MVLQIQQVAQIDKGLRDREPQGDLSSFLLTLKQIFDILNLRLD